MARWISTLVVLGLLGGTAAAFAVTEGLKLERSPITGTRIPASFSPACACPTAVALVRFKLRKPDSVTATVLDSRGGEVRTIADGLAASKGYLTLRWNGRNAAGAIVPAGGYRVRVHLARRHQTITLPNTIQVDLAPPRVTLTRIRPRVFSPDGDGRHDRVAIHFRVTELARPILLVDGRRAIRGRLTRGSGVLYWAGRMDGKTLPAGTYSLTLRAQDVAGNKSTPSRPHAVVINYVDIPAGKVRVRAGKLFRVPIVSDARRVSWRLDGETGFVRPGRHVRLRAPKRPGRYRLVVSLGGKQASAVVIVRKK